MFDGELTLQRRVPLLDVAGAQVAVDGEHALVRDRHPASAESARRSGPAARTNAGVMLSSVRCDTVCRNGKTGVVNGVVIPAISIQIIP